MLYGVPSTSPMNTWRAGALFTVRSKRGSSGTVPPWGSVISIGGNKARLTSGGTALPSLPVRACERLSSTPALTESRQPGETL